MMPTVAVLIALALGKALASVDVSADAAFVFQGTAEDARPLLPPSPARSSRVIALVLSLTLVALQRPPASSPRGCCATSCATGPTRSRVSIFVATFAYSTAGLYTVGVSNSSRTAEYPRLAVTVAIVLIFACLAALVYFIDHWRTRSRSTW